MNDEGDKKVELTKEENALYREYLDTLHAMDLLGHACFEMRSSNLSCFDEAEFLEKYKLLGRFWQHYRER